MLTVKFTENNMLYVSDDGIPLLIALRQVYRINQYLTVLYFYKDKIHPSMDIYWDGDLFFAQTDISKFVAFSMEKLSEIIQRYYDNMIFS